MPKFKTHSGMRKRVKITGSGKILHAGSGKRHHLEKKSTRVTRRADGMHEVAAADTPRVRRMLGI